MEMLSINTLRLTCSADKLASLVWQFFRMWSCNLLYSIYLAKLLIILLALVIAIITIINSN